MAESGEVTVTVLLARARWPAVSVTVRTTV